MLNVCVVNVETLSSSYKKVELEKLPSMIHALATHSCIITSVSSYDSEEANEGMKIKDIHTPRKLKKIYEKNLVLMVLDKYKKK